MKAGVSSACLYPKLLEESVYDLALGGIMNVEIFFNTDCELEKGFVSSLKATLDRFGVSCVSVHPYTCAIETMMFFTGYPRRVNDGIEYYKKYFSAMNILGAEIFVFHGSKKGLSTSRELYFENYYKLYKTGKEFGITVAQENVSRCESGSLDFLSAMADALGSDAKFVLDTKQSIRAGENNFDILKKLSSHIVHVHLSDHGQTGDCLRIGKGKFNIRHFLSLLNEKSHDASVMIELYRNNFGSVSDLVEDYGTLESLIKTIQKGV